MEAAVSNPGYRYVLGSVLNQVLLHQTVIGLEAKTALEKYGINDVETIQVAVSTLGSNHAFTQQPAPWIITGKAGE